MAFETSPLYKEAIEKESRTTFIDGELISPSGAVIPLNNESLEPGGFYITNQCASNDSLEFGSIFSAEMGITLKTEIDRYTLYDSKIKPYFNILLKDKTYERIPLGVFNVNEPSRVGRNVVIKAYDNMINLEEDLYESTTGTPFELLVYIATRCNVSLAQEREDILKLVNGGTLLTVEVSRVSTYRELLSYIAQVTCTFAAFDREGKLRLYEYGTEVTKVINAKERASSKFSDFDTYFSGAKGQLIFGDSFKSYTQASGESGIVYDMGEVPIVQGLDTTNHGIVANVSQKVQSISYTPCDITFNGDPSIDLGDMIANIDRSGNEVISLVTYYKWTYRGRHQIKSAGQNPKLLKLKGKQSKEVQNLKSDVTAKELTVYTYTNASVLDVQGETEELNSMNSANISFSSKKVSTCLAMTTIPYEASIETDVEVVQYLNDEEMFGGTIYQRCHAGKGTISFFNYFNTEANAIHRYTIKLQTKGIGEEEPGAITVAPYTMRMAVFGQGLSSLVQWDGMITVNDIVPVFDVVSNKVDTVKFIDGNISANGLLFNPHSNKDIVREITVVKNKISVNLASGSITTAFDY